METDLNGWEPRRSGVFLPLDAEIVKPSVEVKLPSTEALRDSAEEELNTANNGMTILDGVERYGMAAAGAILGGCALFMGAAAAGSSIGRLRN